jgi:hypothetical protein
MQGKQGSKGASAPAPAVGFATVLAGSRSFKDEGIDNINDTYRGSIYIAAGDIRLAITKDLPLRELANEVLATALAHALELPVPPAFIARAAPADLAAKKAPKMGAFSIVFASCDVASPSVAQLVVSQPDPLSALRPIASALLEGGLLPCFYGFDAWAANTDRHVGNMLFGNSKKAWLIDHGRCFTGPTWQPSDLDPSAVCRNRLREWLTPLLSDEDRNQIATQAAHISMSFASIDVRAIAEANAVPALVGKADFDALINFLLNRVAHVPRLAAHALDRSMVA